MNRKYSQEVKDFAAKTYIHDDIIIPKIKENILEKYDVDIPVDTLYQWSKEQGWKELRTNAIARARDKTIEIEADLDFSQIYSRNRNYHHGRGE